MWEKKQTRHKALHGSHLYGLRFPLREESKENFRGGEENIEHFSNPDCSY
jgi:hypothetical protein